MSWVYLLLAGFFEIGFTTSMRLSEGFSRLWPTLLFVLFAAIEHAAFWLTHATCSHFLFEHGFIAKPVSTFANHALSFISLQRSLRDIPLGTAYAVWTGIGAAGTFFIGILLFQEAMDAARVFLVAVLIASIAGLKLLPH